MTDEPDVVDDDTTDVPEEELIEVDPDELEPHPLVVKDPVRDVVLDYPEPPHGKQDSEVR